MVYFNDLKDLKKLEHHLVSYKRKAEKINTERDDAGDDGTNSKKPRSEDVYNAMV